MSRSQTTSKNRKSKTRGTAPTFQQWKQKCKRLILARFDEWTLTSFSEAKKEYEDRLTASFKNIPHGFDDDLVQSLLAQSDPKKEAELLLVHHQVQMNALRTFIKKAKSFFWLYHESRIFYLPSNVTNDLKGKVNLLYRIPNSVSFQLSELLDQLYNQHFPLYYEHLWQIHFTPVIPEIWFNELDKHACQLASKKKRFRFYWTIYKSFNKKVYSVPIEDLHFSAGGREQQILDEIKSALIDRCLTNRPKLKINCTERQLTHYLSKTWLSTVDFRLEISSIDNFIKSNFACSDSFKEIVDCKYLSSVSQASALLALIRNQYDQNFGARIIEGQSLKDIYGQSEFRRWIEFAFRDCRDDGFSEENVATYFERNTYRTANMAAYRIKKVQTKTKAEKYCYGKRFSGLIQTNFTPL